MKHPRYSYYFSLLLFQGACYQSYAASSQEALLDLGKEETKDPVSELFARPGGFEIHEEWSYETPDAYVQSSITLTKAAKPQNSNELIFSRNSLKKDVCLGEDLVLAKDTFFLSVFAQGDVRTCFEVANQKRGWPCWNRSVEFRLHFLLVGSKEKGNQKHTTKAFRIANGASTEFTYSFQIPKDLAPHIQDVRLSFRGMHVAKSTSKLQTCLACIGIAGAVCLLLLIAVPRMGKERPSALRKQKWKGSYRGVKARQRKKRQGLPWAPPPVLYGLPAHTQQASAASLPKPL